MRALFVLFFCSFSSLAIVPPEYDDPIEPWQSSIEFGWMYDKGNKTTHALNSVLIIDYDADSDLTGHIEYNFDYASDDGVPYTKRGRIQLQGDYALSDEDYIFLRVDLKKHKFASFAKEQTYSSGYGKTFLDENEHKLSLEIGPGYRYSEPQKTLQDQTKKKEGIVRSVIKYQRSFTESIKFYLDTSLETGNKNTISNIDAKLENKILNDLSLVFSFSNTYTKNVPVGAVNNEFTNKINVRYLF
ncbi:MULTISPECIES: DUF481 domain-containing protein [unclassified Motilimonas]|uniref:DUF481 domain-containing protein n=1 Tax=Motilimonas TaxID=1914248 RepID=UPI001E41AA0A|nr:MULTISPECIES: DUF481 domain-containing protein [unclassified Motilimonas]MCE0557130.1 DUF481 domain-containing protein [Motilimonas sp. E26]MDO6524365.1 DUF481 domain-containing protein [Motilimonas sp. 1_MG-2023]